MSKPTLNRRPNLTSLINHFNPKHSPATIATHLMGRNKTPVRKIRDIPLGEALLQMKHEKIETQYRKRNPCSSGYVEVLVLNSNSGVVTVRRDSLSAVR